MIILKYLFLSKFTILTPMAQRPFIILLKDIPIKFNKLSSLLWLNKTIQCLRLKAVNKTYKFTNSFLLLAIFVFTTFNGQIVALTNRSPSMYKAKLCSFISRE